MGDREDCEIVRLVGRREISRHRIPVRDTLKQTFNRTPRWFLYLQRHTIHPHFPRPISFPFPYSLGSVVHFTGSPRTLSPYFPEVSA